jgi:kinesin family protein 18/19
MIATVASAAVQYSHTINTLKYADRAKEIKTHVRRNTGTVDTHITEYQRVIDNLQEEVAELRRQLSVSSAPQGAAAAPTAVVPETTWVQRMALSTAANARQRLTLQQKLYTAENALGACRFHVTLTDEALPRLPAGRSAEKKGVAQVCVSNVRD